jgi:hypothetical protein
VRYNDLLPKEEGREASVDTRNEPRIRLPPRFGAYVSEKPIYEEIRQASNRGEQDSTVI